MTSRQLAARGLQPEKTTTMLEIKDLHANAGDKPVLKGLTLTVKAGAKSFPVICRIDTPVEVEYYGNGGILQTVLRQMMHN